MKISMFFWEINVGVKFNGVDEFLEFLWHDQKHWNGVLCANLKVDRFIFPIQDS